MAGLVIPVTVAVTVLFLWVIGESFNLMTLGGLAAAIGLVIDDAIVVVENIVLHRDSGETRVEAVRKALHEITAPLIGSTITPVVVFLPLIAVTGVTGSFFRALADHHDSRAAYVAFARGHLDARTQPGPPAAIAAERCREHHEEHAEPDACAAVFIAVARTAPWTGLLRKPLMLAACCAILVLGTWFGYQALGSDLLPEMDEGGFVLDYIMPAGSSLTETNRVLAACGADSAQPPRKWKSHRAAPGCRWASPP